MVAPIVTATIQSTAIAGASNFLAQVLDHWRKDKPFVFSPADFLRFIILNLIVAPPNFLWQGWLERTFPARPLTSRSDNEALEMGEAASSSKEHRQGIERHESSFSWANTFKKWFVDCITLGALANTLAFLAIMNLMKGKSSNEVRSAIYGETLPLILASYKIWPVVSLVSFTFVPVEKRIVFLSFIGLIWGIYLSLVAARQ